MKFYYDLHSCLSPHPAPPGGDPVFFHPRGK